MLSRVLALVGSDHPEAQAAKVRSLGLVLLMHETSEAWLIAQTHQPYAPYGVRLAHATGISACLVVAFAMPRWTRAAIGAAAAFVLVQVALMFPNTPNHALLELMLLGLLAGFDDRVAEERDAMLQSCKWLVAIVLFSSGLQKLLHGTYFHGEFLAYLTLTETDRFGWLFERIIPAGELARLHTSDPAAMTYRIDGALAVAVSNAVWVAELLVPIGLLIARVRRYAVFAGIALIVAIEVGAREVTFGVLMTTLLLAHLPRDEIRRLVPVWGAVYAWLIAEWFGLVPQWLY